jgi:DNA-directed RNA polymerase specialized sigma subunit
MKKLTPAQAALVAENKGLAEHLANAAWSQNRVELERDEVVSIAYLGLCAAAIMYDPRSHGMSEETIENGKAFGGYARIKIKGAILDWQKSIDYVPRQDRRLYRDLVGLGFGTSDISYEELAEATGETVERIRSTILAVETVSVSLDSEDGLPVDDDGSSLPTPWVAIAAEDVESDAVVTEILEATADAYSQLPIKHQEVIARKYFYNQGFETIATHMNLKYTKVRSFHRSAVLELMKVMQEKSTVLEKS